VRASDAYGSLVELGRPLVETREVAARLGTTVANASQTLRSLERAGLLRQIRRGLWALEPDVDPFVAAPYLTSPFPAYVSLWSALAAHGMIEQIPRSVYVASLDRTKRIATPIAAYSIHHLAPELFDGFDGTPDTGYLATPEKALFDTIYVRAPRGGNVYFPELSLTPGFDTKKVGAWTEAIARPRMRTMVSRKLESALAHAAVDRP
jgi:predicted transcriptional regulator of viral defense system